MSDDAKTIRCDCDECQDGRRAPMGKLYPDGSMRFIKRYGGKYHKVEIAAQEAESVCKCGEDDENA